MECPLPACFKAYDIRGRVPGELHPQLARDIGRAYAAVCGVRRVAVGRDIRLSGHELTQALTAGLLDSGVDVLDLGICGTEEIYHAAFSLEGEGVDGGIIVTASHNPADYNGMKIVTRGARPVTGESALGEMARRIAAGDLPEAAKDKGRYAERSLKDDYVRHLLGYIDPAALRPMKIVVNSGNGCAGAVVDLLASRLPVEFVRLNHRPDGTFPHGVPNPLLPECRAETGRMVLETGADLGLAWDGDFDRCFFWDERGTFIEGYYIVGLLAQEMLAREQGAKILYDPRLTWNTEELVLAAGGVPVMTRTGHAFIKERMRREDAVYGGEMSAHHYFREFGYCDSGMIPWLLVVSLLSRKGAALSELVGERMLAYPCSGEINFTVGDADAVIRALEGSFAGGAVDRTDGLSIAFADWRFNVRTSNTEPLLRLNVETRGDKALLEEKLAALRQLIR